MNNTLRNQINKKYSISTKKKNRCIHTLVKIGFNSKIETITFSLLNCWTDLMWFSDMIFPLKIPIYVGLRLTFGGGLEHLNSLPIPTNAYQHWKNVAAL